VVVVHCVVAQAVLVELVVAAQALEQELELLEQQTVAAAAGLVGIAIMVALVDREL
jgi:hypothetical protein